MIEVPVKKFDDYIKNEKPIFYTNDLSLRLYKEYDSYTLIIKGYYFATTKIDRLTAFEMIANHLRREFDVFKDISQDICSLQGEERDETIEALKKKIKFDEKNE